MVCQAKSAFERGGNAGNAAPVDYRGVSKRESAGLLYGSEVAAGRAGCGGGCDDSGQGAWFPDRDEFDFVLPACRNLWLLWSSILAQAGHCPSAGCTATGDS